MAYKINHANIKDWARDYDGEPFDAILCDPPYELGFMGKSWDSSGIAFDTDMWADLFKLLKPGGHLLAFSGSRTYHRMACAIEDAGFEIRDMIEWVYGSGFPKSLNIGKAVDKIQGNEREVTGETRIGKTSLGEKSNWDTSDNMKAIKDSGKVDITKGTSPYEGYGTALKPAHEPCVLARKPIEGTVANNVLEYGTGGLNIDGTRVGTEQVENGREGRTADSMFMGTRTNERSYATGRFPANLIHDGSDEVVGLFPDTKSGGGKRRPNDWKTDVYGMSGGASDYEMEASSGSAARFFYCAKASKSERNAGLEGFEEQIAGGMAGRADGSLAGPIVYNKNHHPTVKPLALTKYLANLIKPPTGGRLLVPFSGSGSEMIGALQAGWEYVEGVELTEEYIPIAEARIKYWLDKISKEQMELL
jgi:DNA modification methylase